MRKPSLSCYRRINFSVVGFGPLGAVLGSSEMGSGSGGAGSLSVISGCDIFYFYLVLLSRASRAVTMGGLNLLPVSDTAYYQSLGLSIVNMRHDLSPFAPAVRRKLCFRASPTSPCHLQ